VRLGPSGSHPLHLGGCPVERNRSRQ
jgi:hypothetical protein